MEEETVSRRSVIRGAGATMAGAALFGGFPAERAWAEESDEKAISRPGTLNVRDFGAIGDGKANDTAAFQRALDVAGKAGGNLVFVPRGNYLLRDALEFPEHVVLEGVFRAPTARTENAGSTLLVAAGAGKADGKPFITLHQNSTLHGLAIFYPEQNIEMPPTPYPWTVRGRGDNCSIVDVLLVNPYQAVDFGTYPAGRHYIRGLYAHALYRGLFIDKCFDIGRVEDVHFWPFWKDDPKIHEWVRKEAIAFVIGRTDWEYIRNCFCIFYSIGYHFIHTADGAPNCVLTQCGADVGPVAVRVDDCQGHAGLSFVNGQMMAGIEVKATNRGPVKFTACGFWGVGDVTDHHAVLEGGGHITFNSCHFIGWAEKDPQAPAIIARSGGLTVSACDFMDAGKEQIRLEGGVEAALIYGNRFRGGEKISSKADGKTCIEANLAV